MEGGATVERLENNKRAVLKWAIDDILPILAATSIDEARVFAVATLDDIKQGNNPDLEPSLRSAVGKIGIDLDIAA